MSFKGPLRVAVVAGVTAAAAIGAASASAASLSNTVISAAPEQSIPVSVRFSGASDVPGDHTTLQAVARLGGSIPCQPTLQDDTIAAGTNAQVITDGFANATLGAGTPFSEIAPFTPTQTGSYLVCSWLQEVDPLTNVASVYGPISTRVSVRPPQVTAVKVKLPAHPVPAKAFPVLWSTKTDQSLTLYGVIAHGRSCKLNYSIELGHYPHAASVEGGAAVYGGPVTTSAQATLTTPGHYVLCTWLQGPLPTEVVAHLATPFSVAAPRVHRHHRVRGHARAA
jgi:hypothetical protein